MFGIAWLSFRSLRIGYRIRETWSFLFCSNCQISIKQFGRVLRSMICAWSSQKLDDIDTANHIRRVVCYDSTSNKNQIHPAENHTISIRRSRLNNFSLRKRTRTSRLEAQDTMLFLGIILLLGRSMANPPAIDNPPAAGSQCDFYGSDCYGDYAASCNGSTYIHLCEPHDCPHWDTIKYTVSCKKTTYAQHSSTCDRTKVKWALLIAFTK